MSDVSISLGREATNSGRHLPWVLAVDLGTTGVKVAVVDARGHLVAGASTGLTTHRPEPGAAEQSPDEWWRSIGACANAALGAIDRSIGAAELVELVAVTSQFSSSVVVDEGGRALLPALMWTDERGRSHVRPEAKAARAAWAERLTFGLSGTGSLGHLGYLRDTRGDALAQAAAVLQPMDHLAARLTGSITATQHSAFAFALTDNRRDGVTSWDEHLAALAGVDVRWLAPLTRVGPPRGRLTVEAATHLGVRPGITVADATMDTAAGAAGCGAVTPEHLGLVIGTTTVFLGTTREPRADPANGLVTAPGAVTGTHVLIAENGLGGRALEAFADQFTAAEPSDLGAPDDRDRRIRHCLDAAAGSPRGANGVTFLPWLVGSMAPRFDPRARGGFVGLALEHHHGDLARAVLEGVAVNAAWLRPAVSELLGVDHRQLVLGGGAARSELWAQIVADATGLTVRCLADPTFTTARGAALLALVHAGVLPLDRLADSVPVASVHEPDPSDAARAAEALATLVGLHGRLHPR